MRILIVAVATALLTVPARSQSGGIASGGAGLAQHVGAPQEPKVDPEKKKAVEKAFNDAINRIPAPQKKYDPWGTVRQNTK
jgi:hypothetical protein